MRGCANTALILAALVSVVGVAGPVGEAGAATVTTGGSHTCSISRAGQAFCWGANSYGQLGDATTTSRIVPTAIAGMTDATSLSAGLSHTCGLMAGGTVKCWGLNTNGQLGDNSTDQRTAPVTVSGVTTAVQVVAGGSHTCALLADATVSCWGLNTSGQLGDGSNTQRLAATAVPGLTNVSRIAAGGSHTCAVTGGSVKCWGANANGQLGNGTTSQSSSPVTVSSLAGATSVTAGGTHSCALTAASAVCWGSNANVQLGDGTAVTPRTTPVAVSGLVSPVAISAGLNHTCAIEDTPAVKCWGANGAGQLGDGTTVASNAATTVSGLSGGYAIAAGATHSCAIDGQGHFKCWGDNAAGQVGDGTTNQRTAPVPAIRLAGVRSIALGQYHSCAAVYGGNAYCWGQATNYQLGDGSNTSYNSPNQTISLGSPIAVAAGQQHSCAISASGQAKCWGRNNNAQIGIGNQVTPQTSPVNVSGLTAATAITAGTGHSCAIVTGGQAKCWGANASGQIGDNSTTLRNVPTDANGMTDATAIAAGGSHSCAIVTGGQAKCWGANASGQIGDNTTASKSVPTNVSGLANATAIAAGVSHSCAIVSGGSVSCWGDNLYGQIGDGTNTARSVPTVVSGVSGATSIEAGDFSTCAVVALGAIKCWGSNTQGGLGNGTQTASNLPVDVSGVLGANGVAVGTYHACALYATGATQCWGDNGNGQVGDRTVVARRLTPVTTDVMEPFVSGTGPVEGAIVQSSAKQAGFSTIDSGGTTSQCAFDGEASTGCPSSPFSPGGSLALGYHRVSITATDPSGATGTTNVSFGISVVLPTVAVSSPTAGQQLADATPDISFASTGTNPLTAQCKIDAGSYAACSSPFTPATALAEGAHTATVLVTDANLNTASTSVSFVVDTVAPSLTLSSPVNGSYVASALPPAAFGASDVNGATTECSFGAGYVPCSTGHTPVAALGQGAQSLAVRASDPAGNQTVRTASFTVDTLQPVVNIVAPSPGYVVGTVTPAISFSLTDASATTTQCAVDGGIAVACASPYTTPALGQGSHTVLVTATDVAGNAGSSSIVFTVDTVAPVVSISAPAEGSWLTTTTPSVNFSVADSSVTSKQCSIDNGAWQPCVAPYAVPTLIQGPHDIRIRATDPAGNAGIATVNVVVDTLAPVLDVTTPTDGSAISAPAPNVYFNAADANPTTLACAVDAGSYGTCESPFATPVLADGGHSVSVRVTDAAGNATTQTVNFTVDTVSPSVTVSSPAAGATLAVTTPGIQFAVVDTTTTTKACSIDGATFGICTSPFTTPVLGQGGHAIDVRATDAAGNEATHTVNFTVDSVAPVIDITSPAVGSVTGDSTPDVVFGVTDSTSVTRQCAVDGGGYTNCSSPFTTPVLANGAHTVAVRATDAAGTTTTISVAFTVDTTLPTVAITAPAAAGVLATATPVLSFTTTGSTPLTTACAIDGGSFGACASGATTTTLVDGAHTLAVRVTDSLSRVATTSIVVTIDTALPAIVFSAPAESAVLGTVTPSIAFSASDANLTSVQCATDGGALAACVSPFTPATLAQGAHAIAVRATDAAGNYRESVLNLTLDTITPVLSITAPAAAATVTTATPSIAFAATDATTLSHQCAINGGAFGACASPFTVSLANGLNTVTVRATDAAGNAATQSVTFTVDAPVPAAPAVPVPTPTPTPAPAAPPAPVTGTVLLMVKRSGARLQFTFVLIAPAGVTPACAGSVSFAGAFGKRKIKATGGLKAMSRNGCTAVGTASWKSKKRGKLKLTANFAGSSQLAPAKVTKTLNIK